MEIIIIVVNLSVFILACMDANSTGLENGTKAYDFRYFLGDLIIGCSVCFTLVGLLFVLIKVSIGI